MRSVRAVWLACLWALPAPLPALAADGANLRVVATNVTAATGKLVIWVYQSDDEWLRESGARTQKVVPVADHRRGDTVTVDLLLPAGKYALLVFHDEDGDGQMARNFLGFPKEPAGLSNNARPRFGPPRFKDALVTVGGELTEQRIKLQ